jgi:hypothetical protein
VPPIIVNNGFGQNLNDHNRGLLTYRADGNYQANVINPAMDEWHNENCK